MAHNYVECIDFPNGKGYTPCTQEYRDTYDARAAICDMNDGESIHDLDYDEYQAWSALDDKLAQLQLSGHLGQSVRF